MGLAMIGGAGARDALAKAIADGKTNFIIGSDLVNRLGDFGGAEATASLWLDMEDSPEAAYTENQFDRVTQVTAFVYSQRDDMFTRARRYFRSDEAEDLKRIFLSHYTGDEARIQTQVHERTGVWIVREAIAGRA